MTITIDEIKKLDAARTSGYWNRDKHHTSMIKADCNFDSVCSVQVSNVGEWQDNANFIAATPMIIDKCFELDEVNKQLLSDHQIMKDALKFYSERENWEGRYSFDVADRALKDIIYD